MIITTDHGHTLFVDDHEMVPTPDGPMEACDVDYGVTVCIPHGKHKWAFDGEFIEGDFVEGELVGHLATEADERVPINVMDGSKGFVQGFLQSLFENVGFVNTDGLPILKMYHTSLTYLQDVQALLERFSVISRVVKRGLEQRGRSGLWELAINHTNMIEFEKCVTSTPVKKYLDEYGRRSTVNEPFTTKVLQAGYYREVISPEPTTEPLPGQPGLDE